MLKSNVGDYSHTYIAYITVKETISVANTLTEDFAGNNTNIKTHCTVCTDCTVYEMVKD